MKRLLLALVLSGAFCMAQEHAASEGPATHEEEGDPRIVLKWANFAILAIILGWALAKSLPPFFTSRSEEIAKGIAEATKLKADAEAKAAQIEQRMAQLGAEIETLRAKAKQEMQVEADRIKRETENFLARIHENGLAEIEAASKRAKAELKAQAAEQALDLAEQRIRAGLTNGEAIVERFISDLGKKGSNN
jgi:F-type H+-transporting ATPase subunit b